MKRYGGMRLACKPLVSVVAAAALALGGGSAAFAAGAPSLTEDGPLAAAAAALEDSEPEQSAGGSVVGILIDNTPVSGGEGAPEVNDSYLGILLSPIEAAGAVTVTFMLDADEVLTSVTVPWGGMVTAFEDPKRAGYRFGGWHEDAEGGGDAWSFDEPVREDLVLWARWDVRLDVTVPVAVGFAIDADTGAATGPDAGRYALKSRTVVPVEVDRLAVESAQDELDGFFELRAGAGGADAWHDALSGTELSVAAEGTRAIRLPFAGEMTAPGMWAQVRPLTADEKAAFRLDAFDYDRAGTVFEGDAWQGADPSERLPLTLGLAVSERLKVRSGIDGMKPITHLKVTVAIAA